MLTLPATAPPRRARPISILSQLVAELTRLDADRIASLKASLQARAVSLFDDLEAIDAELDAHLYDASDGGVERQPEGPGGDDGTLAARSRRHQRQRRDRGGRRVTREVSRALQAKGGTAFGARRAAERQPDGTHL